MHSHFQRLQWSVHLVEKDAIVDLYRPQVIHVNECDPLFILVTEELALLELLDHKHTSMPTTRLSRSWISFSKNASSLSRIWVYLKRVDVIYGMLEHCPHVLHCACEALEDKKTLVVRQRLRITRTRQRVDEHFGERVSHSGQRRAQSTSKP